MAFFAGSVYGTATMDDTGWKKGMSGMTGSMLKSQIVFAALQKGVQIITDVIKKSIVEFKNQERVDTQLNAVLKSTQHAAGLTAREIKNMASALQSSTNFTDDAIQEGQNLLLTFTKIGKEVFPQATETILDMSQALGQDVKASAIQLGKALQDPILGITALRRVGVNFTEDQKKMVAELVKTGQIEKAQALILKELQTEFGGSAKAARDTFGGSLKALENIQGELYETIGQVVSIIGKDFVNNMVKGATAVKDFLSSAEGIEKISNIAGVVAGVFATFGTVIKDKWLESVKSAKTIIASFTKNLKDMGLKSEDGLKTFSALAVVTKVSSMGMAILTKVITVTIDNFFLLFKAVKTNIELLGTLYNVLAKKGSWDEHKKKMEETSEAWKDFGGGLKDGFKDIVETTVSEFKKLPDEIKVASIKYQKVAIDTAKETKEKVKEGLSGTSEIIAEELSPPKTAGEKWKEFWDNFKAKASESAEKLKGVVGKIQDVFNSIDSAVRGVWSSITSTINMSLDNDMTAIQNHHAAIISEMESQQEKELSIKQSQYDSQLAALQSQYDAGLITEADYNTRKEALETQSTNILDAINKQYNAKITAENEDFRRKEYEQKKKAFEINKAFSIVQIWLDFAAATMGFWAAYAGIPIAGPIIAGVLTATALGVAIAQTVLVSQQQMPAYRTGGTVGGAREIIMNERGGEIARLPDGTTIVPNDISRQIGAAAGNTRNQNISVSFAGANITDNVSMKKVVDYVIREIGRKVK